MTVLSMTKQMPSISKISYAKYPTLFKRRLSPACLQFTTRVYRDRKKEVQTYISSIYVSIHVFNLISSSFPVYVLAFVGCRVTNMWIIFLKGYCVVVRVEILHKSKFLPGTVEKNSSTIRSSSRNRTHACAMPVHCSAH